MYSECSSDVASSAVTRRGSRFDYDLSEIVKLPGLAKGVGKHFRDDLSTWISTIAYPTQSDTILSLLVRAKNASAVDIVNFLLVKKHHPYRRTPLKHWQADTPFTPTEVT